MCKMPCKEPADQRSYRGRQYKSAFFHAVGEQSRSATAAGESGSDEARERPIFASLRKRKGRRLLAEASGLSGFEHVQLIATNIKGNQCIGEDTQAVPMVNPHVEIGRGPKTETSCQCI